MSDAAQETWFTTTRANTSPVERDRDAKIERLLVNDGRPLSSLAVLAVFDGKSIWTVTIHDRLHMLAYLDQQGREAEHESDRELVKKFAAWIRSLPPGVCPEIFDWGDGRVSQGTIRREQRQPSRHGLRPAPRRGRGMR